MWRQNRIGKYTYIIKVSVGSSNTTTRITIIITWNSTTIFLKVASTDSINKSDRINTKYKHKIITEYKQSQQLYVNVFSHQVTSLWYSINTVYYRYTKRFSLLFYYWIRCSHWNDYTITVFCTALITSRYRINKLDDHVMQIRKLSTVKQYCGL